MSIMSKRACLLCSAFISAGSLYAAPAFAQSQNAASAPSSGQVEEVVVTGSRIRRIDTDTAAPVTTVGAELMAERGYVQVGEALNQISSIVPFRPVANGGAASSGDGKQYPNLYGLGGGRTLTLVNGRRFVGSASGLGDTVVDTNLIPSGLLERVDVVQAGGAAVYGSDAVSGVVNYILKKNFDGVEVDAQLGVSSRNDLHTQNYRLTAGRNFQEGRGNVAVNLEYSRTPPLLNKDRPAASISRTTVSNPRNTSNTDGIPSVMEVVPARFYNFTTGGVVVNTHAPQITALTQLNGTGVQFAPSGDVTAFNPGTFAGIPFSFGGDGYRLSELGSLYTGVDRYSGNVIGHYDLTDKITVSTELLYSRTTAVDLNRGILRNVLNTVASNQGPIAFTINNPFLTAQARSQLSLANPAFATGGTLFLSKVFEDLVPSNAIETNTDVYRGVLAFNGDFDALDRNFYWNVSGSWGETRGRQRAWGANNVNLNKALDAVRNVTGAIVCGVNSDAITANDDPACVALNPFGAGNISKAAQAYVATRIGTDYTNRQTDVLATLGGSIITLPAGDLSFSVGYEHRTEEAKFTPLLANQAGLTGTGNKELPSSGSYNTNEFSGELLAPILGKDFTFPFAQRLELSAAYRFVDNSIAGREKVWSLGGQFEPVRGVTFRASRSRNFRAPNLNQLFAPSSTAIGTITQDPCDADRINGGPSPAIRLANCRALFAANPAYGNLATFQDPAENFTTTAITTRGNSALRNEVSKTTTYGIVLEPGFAPGLQVTADLVAIDLRDGLSTFTTQNFLATCFDSSPQPADICGNFYTRLPAAANGQPAGTVITGTTTTFNAGLVKYRGEVYQASYRFGLNSLLHNDADLGSLSMVANATHNTTLQTSVTGFDQSVTNDTVAQPQWRVQFNAVYKRGPLSVSYNVFWMPDALATKDATIENNPNPVVGANTTQDISARYDFKRFVLRAGVINFTDEMPSYPSLTYGDILGRRYFMGVTARF